MLYDFGTSRGLHWHLLPPPVALVVPLALQWLFGVGMTATQPTCRCECAKLPSMCPRAPLLDFTVSL
jgi:hypothetical protein